MSSYQLVKQFSTQEPATCLQFTATSIIIGTDRFFEVDLTNFAIEGQCAGRDRDGRNVLILISSLRTYQNLEP